MRMLGLVRECPINPPREAPRTRFCLSKMERSSLLIFAASGREAADSHILKGLKQNEVEIVWVIWLLGFFSAAGS